MSLTNKENRIADLMKLAGDRQLTDSERAEMQALIRVVFPSDTLFVQTEFTGEEVGVLQNALEDLESGVYEFVEEESYRKHTLNLLASIRKKLGIN